jgi:hypothetical protein
VTPPESVPNAFPADDFEIGDQIALEIQPDRVYDILDRNDRLGDMLEFQVRRTDGPTAEQLEFTFTFPARMLVSARRRTRNFTRGCMTCQKLHTVTINTAYSTLNSVVCREH